METGRLSSRRFPGVIVTAGRLALVAVFALLVGAGCTGSTGDRQQQPESSSSEEPMASGTETPAKPITVEVVATCILEPTEGNDVHGTVTFRQVEGGVSVTARIEGLSEGEHGFHVHETGDCSAPDASSAGGHFNPDGTPHGPPSAPESERHVGDLGNITAGADGVAEYDRVDPLLALSGPHSIDGLAVVVHQGRDDLTSQPSGAAGARVACGIIHLQEGSMDMEEQSGH